MHRILLWVPGVKDVNITEAGMRRSSVRLAKDGYPVRELHRIGKLFVVPCGVVCDFASQ